MNAQCLKLHLGCADDIRSGFENFDPKINGWTFQSGLPYPDSTVDGITISHALMYVPKADWPGVVAEFYRALRPGGVVRITEDDCETPNSPRRACLYPGAAVLTGPQFVGQQLRLAGFATHRCSATETLFHDDSLCIAHREHKIPRYIFYMEGVKP